MRSRTSPLAIALLTLAAAALAPAASAQEKSAEADRLFKAGLAALKEEDFASACRHLAESQRVEPAAGTLLYLALCEERTNRRAEALRHYRRALDQLPPGDDRRKTAHDRVAALENVLPRLTVRLADGSPPDAQASIDGEPLRADEVGLAKVVDAGDHEITANATGREETHARVSLKDAESKTVVVAVGAPARAAPPVAEPVPVAAGAPAPTGTPPARTIGFVVAGIGVVGIGVGAVTGLLTLSQKNAVDDACAPGTPSACSAAGLAAAREEASVGRTYSTVSTIAFIAGAASLAAGVTLVLTSRSTRVDAAVAPGGATVRLVAAFR
jgi:hypothetical protein